MTTDDPLDDNPLEALHAEVAPDGRLDERVAGRIEASLRVAHAEQRTTWVPWWRRSIALAPAAVLVVVAISAAVILRTETPSAALVITDAENVTIVLPSGDVVTDPADGFELPDGAVIEIGAAGMVSIDGVVIDEPARFSVVDGSLVSDVIATTTTPARPDHLDPPPTSTVESMETTTTTTAAPVRAEPVDTTTTVAERSTTTTTTTESPQRDGDDRDREDDRRDDDAEPGPAVGIGFTVDRVDDDGARIEWNVTGAPVGWTVSIVRTIGEGGPVAVVIGGPLTGELVEMFGPDQRGRVRYRLVVLDEAGGEVASAPRQGLRR
ncbi:MAG: hypothetical protein AAF081_19640 [Actinomycetota bacterium]